MKRLIRNTLLACSLLVSGCSGNTPNPGKTTPVPTPTPSEEKILTDITLNKTTLSYEVGDKIDLSDVSATLGFSNGEKETYQYVNFAAQAINVTLSFDNKTKDINGNFDAAGNWTLTASKGQFSDSLTILVNEQGVVTVSKIEVTKTKVNYTVNDSVSYGDVRIKLTYSDGSVKENIRTSALTTHGLAKKMMFNGEEYKSNKYLYAGTYTIVVYLVENEKLQGSVDVEVAPLTIASLTLAKSTKSYFVGDVLDLSDVTVTLKYSNNTSATIDYDGLEQAGIVLECYFKNAIYDVKNTLSETGTYTLKASLEDDASISSSLDINVQNDEISAISASKTSKSYHPGEIIDYSDLSCTVTYLSGKYYQVAYANFAQNNLTVSLSLNGSAVALDTTLEEGTYTLTVSLGGTTFTSSLTINVREQGSLAKTEMKSTYQTYGATNAYGCDYSPSKGKTKLLIVPVWFTDSSTYINTSKKADVRSAIQNAYLGTASSTGWNSVKSFYETESMGALEMTGVVTDWYECGQKSSSFYSESQGANNTMALVSSAVDWYFGKTTAESRTSFDCDRNGYLDGVMLIYGAPDYSATGDNSASNMWAYCYWTDGEQNVNKPGECVYFWASYDFMFSSSDAQTITGKSSYGTGDTSHCTIDAHTFIHEMGHVFGLEDYYDYSSRYNPAGGFSMQDCNVGGHDPFSVMALGWASPYIPEDSCTITINDFQSSHDLILLTPSWNSYDSPFDEYILLELYTPTGLNEFDTDYCYGGRYPQGSSTPGIRVWHVDARLVYVNSNNVRNNEIVDLTESQLTTNPNYNSDYGVLGAFSNTYYSSDVEGYCSILGKSYADWNLLQLIRNSSSGTYKPTDDFASSSLFKQGDTFTMSKVSGQFKNSGKLNSKIDLGWSFTVDSLSSSSATLTLTRA